MSDLSEKILPLTSAKRSRVQVLSYEADHRDNHTSPFLLANPLNKLSNRTKIDRSLLESP